MDDNPDSLILKLANRSIIISNILTSAHRYCSKFTSAIPEFAYSGKINLENNRLYRNESWIILSSGDYSIQVNSDILKKLIEENKNKIIMLNVNDSLASYRENIITATYDHVIGYRRFFTDSILPDQIPNKWPHIIIGKASVLKSILKNNLIPARFSIFLKQIIFSGCKIKSYRIGGQLNCLQTEDGILNMIDYYLRSNHDFFYQNRINEDNSRLYGSVILGEKTKIGEGAVIIGPTIIGENVDIPSSVTIYNSIICPGAELKDFSFIRKQIAGLYEKNTLSLVQNDNKVFVGKNFTNDYKILPLFSYARIWKRLFDIAAALFVLPLFAIIFIIIAPIIKLTSSGPVFFKHKRQGLHGKAFSCLKFRTMIVNADDIQQKLGFKNQVDGPQFKIDNDPRVTTIGKFLRETHIDEIPQFLNILMGQMSLIGPRPSPARENSFCSYWRDARLSVRPGITGMWQVYRTRQSGQDFQEWIYYDTRYVKNISLLLDIKIFFKTAVKLFVNFIKHF